VSIRELLGLGNRELISLVGGGGKSTLMFALGNELAGEGNRVILTTTTKMGRGETERLRTIKLSDDASQITRALDGSGPVLLVDSTAGHRVTGPSGDQVDQLYAGSGADYIIVEADGSRGRPLKAPAEHEPVLPAATTTVVMVVGVDAVGRPLVEVAHRTEQAVAFSGKNPHDVLTAADCARILTHPAGLLRACPATARVIAAITKVGPAEAARAAELRRELAAEPRISEVVLLDGSPRHHGGVDV
jgi:molybdenum cofactor cytidylyltransferase